MQIPTERQPHWQSRKALLFITCAALTICVWMTSSGVVTGTSVQAFHSSPVTRGNLNHQISAFGVLVPQKVQSLIAMTEGRVSQLAQCSRPASRFCSW